MKILIVSDSHGLVSELNELKLRYKDEVKLFVHCGDSELPASNSAIADYVMVQGNCDYEDKYPKETTIDIGNKKLFVTHGHLYGVKSSVNNLVYKAKEVGADIVCFGHSHYLGMEMIDSTLFINPGSLRLPRGRAEKTYVILNLKEDKFVLEVYDYERGLLSGLTTEFPYSSL